MNIVNQGRFEQLVQDALKADCTGWDFSWLEGRMLQQDPPWNYSVIVKERLPSANSLLDMGTGDGAFLASLAPLPEDTHATECYPPNQIIAKALLAPLQVTVHPLDEDEALPFDANRFDLVINRHDSFGPHEVFQILKPGGLFITQQVGGLDNLELNQVLEESGTLTFTEWDLASALTGMYNAGFHVLMAEKAALQATFLDIGAVIYYLKAIPWQVSGFNTKTHMEGLIKIHNIIACQGRFLTTAHRFLIIAQKE